MGIFLGYFFTADAGSWLAVGAGLIHPHCSWLKYFLGSVAGFTNGLAVGTTGSMGSLAGQAGGAGEEGEGYLEEA